jgi:hypothetical protein
MNKLPVNAPLACHTHFSLFSKMEAGTDAKIFSPPPPTAAYQNALCLKFGEIGLALK